MAIQQLKVEEFQTQLGQRGLSTTGTKPTLFDDSKQLCAKKTSNQLVQKNGLSANKKRDRDSENGDSIGSQQKIMAVEKFREMGIQQLCQQAALRGISATGSMKEIIKRLSKDSNHDLQDCPQADEEESESNEEKIVTATKKGAAVLDQWLPDDIKDDEIYDAMLNQTNVGDNNNKLYMIQALESNDGSAFMVYNRWGRVGIRVKTSYLIRTHHMTMQSRSLNRNSCQDQEPLVPSKKSSFASQRVILGWKWIMVSRKKNQMSKKSPTLL